MKACRSVVGVIQVVACTAVIAASGSAGAAAQRTFVSVGGSDTNSCAVASPCRSFARAISQTNTGGEVIAVDSGGYGAVTVTTSVTIAAPAGVYAGISVFSGDGVTIAAGSTDSVTLRGVAITAQGGSRGVRLVSGSRLEIDRCIISGAFSEGIDVNGPLAADVLVKDTQISKVVFSGYAIHVEGPGGEHIRVTVTDSVLNDVGTGIFVEAGGELAVDNSRLIGVGPGNGEGVIVGQAGAQHAPIEAHVTNSLIRGFSTGAVAAQFASFASLSVAASELSHNSNAVLAQQGATVALTGNRIVHNALAISTNPGGVVFSSGTNYSAYNGTPGDPVTWPAGLF